MFLLLLGLYFNFLPALVTSTGHGSGVWMIAGVQCHRHYSSIYTVDIYMVDISTHISTPDTGEGIQLLSIRPS